MPHALTLVYPGLSRYQRIKYSIPLRFCCDLAKLFPSSVTWRHGYQSCGTIDYSVIRFQSIHFSVSLSYRKRTKRLGLHTQQKWKLSVIRKSEIDTLRSAMSKWIMIDELRRQSVKEFKIMFMPTKPIFAYNQEQLHNDFKFNLPMARNKKTLRNVRGEVDMLLAVQQRIKQRVCQQLA